MCYLIFLMSEKLSEQDRDKWKDRILKLLEIDDSYYKSKYKEPFSDFPSDSTVSYTHLLNFKLNNKKFCRTPTVWRGLQPNLFKKYNP